MSAISNALDGLEILVRQVGDLEVALDAGWGGALGQNGVAPAETPGNEDLRKGVAAAVGDLVKGLVAADSLTSGGDLVLGAQGRVCGGQDVVLLAELDELLVGEEGVNFDLVNGGLDLGEGHQLFEAIDGPVGDTNSTSLAASQNLLHSAPCGLRVLSEVLLDDVLAIGADLGLVVVALLGGNGPVDEEEINVVEAEVLEGVLDGPLDLLGLVEVVPDLCADEDVLALHILVLLEEVSHSLANLAFVEVEPGTVEVSVADLESALDSLVGLALGALVSKGAEAQTGHLDTIVEGECGLV